MPTDIQILLTMAIFMVLLGLVMFQKELAPYINKYRCKIGIHDFKKINGWEVIKVNRCIYCRKVKKFKHLKYIKGGKKDIDWIHREW